MPKAVTVEVRLVILLNLALAEASQVILSKEVGSEFRFA
jgi:hypothetical protein